MGSAHSSRTEPLLPAADASYNAIFSPEATNRKRTHLALAVVVGLAVGSAATYFATTRLLVAPRSPTAALHQKHFLPLLVSPAACDGWTERCRAGAEASDEQNYGKFWPAALCADGAKLSCSFRQPAWASPTA